MSAVPPRLLYEDESLIVVDKEAGHLVHASDEPQPSDIVTMKLVRDFVGHKIYPTHRLDRPTCGVLLFAKTKTVARALNRAFERKQIEKCYHAIALGHPEKESWTCTEPLQKDETHPWKDATTDFRVLHLFPEGLVWLEARPLTGRYHQIRRHLALSRHSIVGDYFYTKYETCEEWDQKLQLGKRMLLQCKSLTFCHPISKQTTTIEAPKDPIFPSIVSPA